MSMSIARSVVAAGVVAAGLSGCLHAAPGSGDGSQLSKENGGKLKTSEAMKPTDLHVAVDGDDKNIGTLKKPFASLD